MDLNTPNSKAPKTAVDKAVSFLRRDVRSFLPGWNEPAGAKQETVESDSQDYPVPSLVDPAIVDHLAFRREVLDWRDGFHARATQVAIELCNSFALKIRQDLANTSIFRRVLTRPAYDMLQDHFIRIVRVPMHQVIQQEQSELTELVRRWLPDTTLDMAFPAPWSESECKSLGNLDFTPKNEEVILRKIETMILGDSGIVDTYRTRATNLARNIIEERSL